MAKEGALALTVMLSAVVEEFGGLAESVAVTPKEAGVVVAVVGVPVMAPVLGFKVAQLGSPIALQVTAPAPPMACNVEL